MATPNKMNNHHHPNLMSVGNILLFSNPLCCLDRIGGVDLNSRFLIYSLDKLHVILLHIKGLLQLLIGRFFTNHGEKFHTINVLGFPIRPCVVNFRIVFGTEFLYVWLFHNIKYNSKEGGCQPTPRDITNYLMAIFLTASCALT